MKKISKIILETIKKFKLSPKDINSGLCEDFALIVVKKMGGYKENLYELCTEDFVDFGELSGHVWIYYNGKHYDSECVNGVKNWKDLPFFKRSC